MRALSAAEVLSVWELGAQRPPLERALLLLRAALPDASWADLAALPLGARDRRLVALRAATFGPELRLADRCPACGDDVELTLGAAELLAGGDEADRRAAGPHELRSEGAVVRWRLPDTRDLAAVADLPAGDAERALLARCVVEASAGGAPLSAEGLPGTVRDALARAMAEADPHAEVAVELACPSCSHRWQTWFDALAALWADVSREALRLLQEVDALARGYGWREADVLALSPRRRALYVEMVTG